MDEMKLGSKFMRDVISRILSKLIKKKTGYEVGILLNCVEVTVDGSAHVHLDANLELSKDELTKMFGLFGI